MTLNPVFYLAFHLPILSRMGLLTSLLTVSLAIAPSALADYRPSGNSPPPTSTGTTGTRGGCSGVDAPDLIAIAPYSHVGLTTSSHPTLVWYVPDSEAIPLELHVYEFDPTASTEEQRVLKVEMTSTPGMMSYTLPADQPGLESGRHYRWQVVLLCNPNRPASAAIADAEIQVAPMPTSLAVNLAEVTSPMERAEQYAEAGFWYDAIGAVVNADEPDASTLELSLLNNLAEIDASIDGGDRSLAIQQIIAVEHRL